MNENVINGANTNEGATKELPYKKKGMPKGAKIAIIIVSIVLAVALLFGLLLTAILGFFGVLILLVGYLVTPENDGTFEYEIYGETVEIVGLVDGDFSGELHVPEYIDGKPVTSIGFEAFEASGVEVVYLPDTVENIYGNAFFGCENLREVYMSDNVTYMGSNVFDYCKNLEYVKLSEKLTYIDNCSFLHCASLEMIKIPADVTYISEDAFYGCENLREVYFEDSYGWSVSYYYKDEYKTIEISSKELSDPYRAAELINQYSDYYWEKTTE